MLSLSATAELKSMLASVLQFTSHCIDIGSAVSYYHLSMFSEATALLKAFVSSVRIALDSGQRGPDFAPAVP
jgi:hypothetical protein